MNAPTRPGAHSMRVLVVDDEVNLRFAIERGLRKAGHISQSASTVRQAMDTLRAQPVDVVVCDIRMPGGEGTELVRWLASVSPSTGIIVCSAFITPEIRATYSGSPGLHLVEKPVELSELVRLIERVGPRRGFFGNSIEVELFDYVQMIALSGRDKLIAVTTPAGSGHVWFDHGDIVHAEYGGVSGTEAFYGMLGDGRGSFTEVFFEAPREQTIHDTSTHLLMEAARRMDEGILETSPAPASGPSLAAAPDPMDSGILPADDDEASPHAILDDETPLPDASATEMGLLDDPETRAIMLGQFFEYPGVDGVAIVSSTGKVLAEEMRANSVLVTLAGFYMRGAARIARSVGHNVFDGITARLETGQKLLIVGMGATTAVLSVAADADPDEVRRVVMGGRE